VNESIFGTKNSTVIMKRTGMGGTYAFSFAISYYEVMKKGSGVMPEEPKGWFGRLELILLIAAIVIIVFSKPK